MVSSYFTLYLRNLIRNKVLSIITIAGLAIGLASCFLIMLFVVKELEVDKFQPNRKNVYRVLTENKNHFKSTKTSFLFGPTIKEAFPEVKDYARVISIGSVKVKKENKLLEEPNLFFSDHSLFNLLSFEFKSGKPSELLINPNTIVLSESMAMKYFGSKQVLGKQLEVTIKGEAQLLTITGVYADLPDNSSVKMDFIGDIIFGKKSLMKMLIRYGGNDPSPALEDTWDHTFYYTFLQLPDNHSIGEFEKKINQALKKTQPADDPLSYSLQRYDKIYLHTPTNDSSWKQGSLSDIWVFSSIAFLILLIASFNYVILTLAQSEKRAREIGVRKVSGADMKQLTLQVFIESVTISFIALPLAIGLSELILPLVNNLLDNNLTIDYSQNIIFMVGVLGITLMVSFISGFYISIYLSRLNPVIVLRGGKVNAGVRSVFLKSLVISQMVIFMVLMISSGIILKQLKFVTQFNPGMKPDNLVYIPLKDISEQKSYTIIRQELLKLPEVQSVSAATNNPPSAMTMTMMMNRMDAPDKPASVEVEMVDFNYISTLGLTMAEGRDFLPDFPGDSSAVILNESAVKELGLNDPIGKKIPTGAVVIGVVKDYPIHNLHKKIPAAMLTINSVNIFEMAIRTKVSLKEVMPKIKMVWEKLNPDSKFSFIPFNIKIENQYQSERKLSTIILLFTGIAILIAVLGLLGLSSFISQVRTKEIGIRKVNGGTLWQMIVLYWKDIFWWNGLAFFIACPIGWYVMDRWLQNFAYRTSLDWWYFAGAGILSLFIALITVSWQAYKSARSNPVNSLRYE